MINGKSCPRWTVRVGMWAVRICFLVLVPAALLAQETYIHNQLELESGRLFFLRRCAVCHGPDGDSVQGVDLLRGKFRRASSYDDVPEIIQTGIPNAAMPPVGMSPRERELIVAYLRSVAATVQSAFAPGNAARGKALFEGKGECLDCHRVGGNGSRLGPDLTEVGAVRRLVELQRSLLEPSAEILPENRSVRAVTRDGITITGRLLNRDPFTIQMIDAKDRLLSMQTSSLKDFAFLDQSPMPSYQGKLSQEELADLVSYLVSLKGIQSQ